jgi:hypothetical protein
MYKVVACYKAYANWVCRDYLPYCYIGNIGMHTYILFSPLSLG